MSNSTKEINGCVIRGTEGSESWCHEYTPLVRHSHAILGSFEVAYSIDVILFYYGLLLDSIIG